MMRIAVILPLLPISVGCSTPPPPAPVPIATVRLQLPAGPVPQRPWAVRACPAQPDPTVVACVGNVGIPAERLQFALSEAPTGTSPRAVLQSLVDAEVLAAAAFDAGHWSKTLHPVLSQALVARLLHREMSERFAAKDVQRADLELAFNDPSVRVKFQHAPAWSCTDVQLLCCTGDWRQCEGREDAVACIDMLAGQAKDLCAALKASPVASGPELEARVAVLQPRFPQVATAVVQFFYDPSKPYEQQKGYDLMVKPFALAVAQMQVGEMAKEPIRTPFGWHCPRLDRFKPAEKRTLDDAAVRAELADKIVDLVREREAMRLASGAMHKAGVEFFFERMEPAARKVEAEGEGP
jgi:hypothetical protein